MVRRFFIFFLTIIMCIATFTSCTQEKVKTSDMTPVQPLPDTQKKTEITAFKNKPLDGIVICIDPGHGIFEKSYNEPVGPGAKETKPAFVSGTSGAYISEAQFNLFVAQKLNKILSDNGAEVHMTRTGEKAELSNIERAEFANNLNCNVVIRIHADGASDTSAKGISMLVPALNDYLNDEEIISSSRRIGQIVLNSVIDETGAKNRGVIERYDMTGFNWTEVPVILIECGFMTNPEEDKLLASDSYQQKIAQGISKGIVEYYTQT